ncbi:hypothetical protein ACFVY1_46820, partial [Streptomyces sp. NPDC058293]
MGDTRLEPVVLSEAERLTLESWSKCRSTAQGLAVRARIVLACGARRVKNRGGAGARGGDAYERPRGPPGVS